MTKQERIIKKQKEYLDYLLRHIKGLGLDSQRMRNFESELSSIEVEPDEDNVKSK